MPNPPPSLLRHHNNSNAILRPQTLLHQHPKLQNNLLLHCTTRCSSPRQKPHRLRLRPLFPKSHHLRRSPINKRPHHGRTRATRCRNQASLRPKRNESRHPQPGLSLPTLCSISQTKFLFMNVEKMESRPRL